MSVVVSEEVLDGSVIERHFPLLARQSEDLREHFEAGFPDPNLVPDARKNASSASSCGSRFVLKMISISNGTENFCRC